ncbi:chemotaxis protein CheC [Nitrosopumilus ureiphilus]|uniref:CheC-like protein domain-containing protein n=1 Tax=Nitrosopumilus ureiphilus TaxID=1470067 RepID=A0A7D5R710_9ARCH|nr:chemotaxis protein CheC [Nitrosopumilus ureiphilus]QLH06858.1 hypothetical protein C5F50_07055 [Nitrosopumilus ureiphilus]
MQVSQLSQSDLQKLDKVISAFINKKMVPSLSALTNDEVKFLSIKTSELGLDEISTIVPQTEFQENDVGVYITCEGDMKLGILFHLPLGDAKKLASMLLGSEANSDLSLEGKSSLAEIGNILAASLFNAINEKTGCKIMSSVPGLAIDTAEVLLESPIIETAVSNTFIHIYGELHCTGSQLIISASIFQDPVEAKKIIGLN